MSTLRLTTISNQGGTASVPSDTVINGSAKAWVNFNGTGTVAIRASFNVSSITDNNTGDYTVNFTNAMPDTNYAVQIGVSDMSWGGYGVVRTSSDLLTSSVRIYTFLGSSNTSNLADSNPCSVTIFR